MTDTEPPAARGSAEPPLLERARRIGWALLAFALVAAVLWRASNGMVARVALIVTVATALPGLMAIVNVMLVRALYRQLRDAEAPNP